MVIRIFTHDGECIRYIMVEEEVALPLFNLIIEALGDHESAILYSGDEERIIASVV